MTDDHEQPPLDPLQVWRDRLRKFNEECSADYARRHPEEVLPQAREVVKPLEPVIRALAKVMAREINAVKLEMRREIQLALLRPLRRRKKWTQADSDRYVMSKQGLPPEAFNERRPQRSRSADRREGEQHVGRPQRDRSAKK